MPSSTFTFFNQFKENLGKGVHDFTDDTTCTVTFALCAAANAPVATNSVLADLTQISQRNGGTFPVDRMHQIIDGRADVLAHGGREMPVWGQAFLERTDNEAEVRTKVHQLTVFLESIQEKGPAKKK